MNVQSSHKDSPNKLRDVFIMSTKALPSAFAQMNKAPEGVMTVVESYDRCRRASVRRPKQGEQSCLHTRHTLTYIL
jgi:hypothetical protein